MIQTRIIFFFIALSLPFLPAAASDGNPETTTFPDLKGPYLGQKPPGMIPEIFAQGVVSTKNYLEYSSSFSPDLREFYFTRDLSPGHWVIMHMKQKNCGWTKPKPAFFSGSYKDLEMSVSPDGQKLFFCSNRPLNKGGELKKDFDIWYLLRMDSGWSDPIHAGPMINSKGNEWYPTVSRNGTLYFCGGEKPGLYSSNINDRGNYDKHVMIGDLRKTDIIGGHPYIAPDESYLITSAINGHDTKGGWDLFISFRKSDGSWTRSVNLGGNVNTKANEDFPCISPDGKYLFFTRLFKDDDGNDIADIYWVDAKIIEELKPKELK